MNQKKEINVRVALLVFTTIETPTGPQITAVLQRRGRWNAEKNFGPESWRGGCQLTVSGRALEDEWTNMALGREVYEEINLRLGLAQEIKNTLDLSLVGDMPNVHQIDFVTGIHEIEAVTEPASPTEFHDFIAYAPLATLKKIRWHVSSGGMEFIQEDSVDKIVDITELMDKAGEVKDLSVIAMFPHDIEVVKKGFAFIKKSIARFF